MKKVIILGAKGMLGQALAEEFNDSIFDVYGLDKEEIDITDKKKVEKVFNKEKPDIVINAAAYTDVDGAETNELLAMKVNGGAVGILASASNKIDALFIHISTDYVFDGKNKNGYNEDDKPNSPETIYGKSKLLGEDLLLKEGERDLKYYLVRTSWLFGKNGKNFVTTILELSKNINELKVVDDQYGKPTHTKDLAKNVHLLIESKKIFGIYHITNEPAMTWYEFTKMIFKIKNKTDPSFSSPKLLPVSSEEFPRPAKRPNWSILNNTKLEKGRSIEEALKEYLC